MLLDPEPPQDGHAGDPAAGGFSRCLFCRAPLPSAPEGSALPPGRRFAFDPTRGRVWIVCGTCRRWNLLPLAARAGALEALERLSRDEGRLLYHTAHVALLVAGELDLVRVGVARLDEEAWWRYGYRLRRRRLFLERRGTRLGASALGALARVGKSLGLADPSGLARSDAVAEDVMRRLRFGREAWRGRVRCPYCGSVLRALDFDDSWWLIPSVAADGRLGLGVPCPRCDPWTPENVFRLEGEVAELVLRRALAYQNVAGASEAEIRAAAARIEAAGSARDFARSLGDGRSSLWRIGPARALALEIALGDAAEREALAGEARGVEVAWRQEEELARIVDEELE